MLHTFEHQLGVRTFVFAELIVASGEMPENLGARNCLARFRQEDGWLAHCRQRCVGCPRTFDTSLLLPFTTLCFVQQCRYNAFKSDDDVAECIGNGRRNRGVRQCLESCQLRRDRFHIVVRHWNGKDDVAVKCWIQLFLCVFDKGFHCLDPQGLLQIFRFSRYNGFEFILRRVNRSNHLHQPHDCLHTLVSITVTESMTHTLSHSFRELRPHRVEPLPQSRKVVSVRPQWLQGLQCL
mmetsp:Transcript_32557/g.87406  ORF Transcript_32557/g.87406 Transcript_32557/m.87406 type:complete len:237 (+) Transcript_32557:377-1087(+)